VVTTPLGIAAGTAIGGAIGGGIGSLACGTPPFPDQSDIWSRPKPRSIPKPKDCDAKPRALPFHIDIPWEPQPFPDRDGCWEEISDCTVWCSGAGANPNLTKASRGKKNNFDSCMQGCVSENCKKGTWLGK
jgi:hypothetical protein